MSADQKSSATAFHQLHQDLLILPNAWDAGSARLAESLGARAIATTSAGLAWSHGYADGNVLPLDVLSSAIREIARVITVPLSTDIEGGYSDDLSIVGDTVAVILDAGAVGINIEDGSAPPDLLCRKIERVREVALQRGIALYINARTDVYLERLVPPEQALNEALRRASLYQRAGADGIFVPAAIDAATLHSLARQIPLPLNVLAQPGVPAATELRTLGIRRLSAGSGIAQNAWKRAESLMRGFLDEGRSDALFEHGRPYAEINALFSG